MTSTRASRSTPEVPVTTPTKQQIVGWARLWPAVRPPHSRDLRAGAWYPILKDRLEDRITIWRYSAEVDVPRRFMEIRPRRPDRFTVVYRVGYDITQRRRSKHNLGKRYAVCPVSQTRFALPGHPDRITCPSCGHEGEIAWWETG